MAKAKIPNQKKAYERLNKRLSKYVGRVRAIYDELNLEASKIAARTGYDSSSGKEFRFSDYPNVTAQVKDLQDKFVNDIKFTIVSGISTEWRNSNEMQDLLADKVLKAYNVKRGDARTKRYYQVNNDALKSFQQRKDKGMNLSQKIWNQSDDYKQGLESAISTAIEKGMSAVILSKKVSKYLNDFDSLKKDYKKRFGTATEAKDCEYRSIRLARSEINMAYRNAEQLRWQQMDFILGYEIKLSHSHPCADICDDLAGRYPKDFKWTGWHPNDMCYVIPIIKSEELFWMPENERGADNEEITDVPQGFKDWVGKNQSRIAKAEKRGTLPYFVRDNKSYMNVMSVEEIAKVRHAKRDEKAIRRAWRNRKILNDEYFNVANIRRQAKISGVNIDELEKFISNEELHIDSNGHLALKDYERVENIFDKYENRIKQQYDDYNLMKQVAITEIEKYSKSKFFIEREKNALRAITYSSEKPISEAIKEVNELRRKLDGKFKDYSSNAISLKIEKQEEHSDSILFSKASDKDKYDFIRSSLEKLYGERVNRLLEYKDIFSLGGSGRYKDAVNKYFEIDNDNSIGEILKSINKLKVINNADTSLIPKQWIVKYNDYISAINGRDFAKNGYYNVWREIEGAYNIVKLSSDKSLVKYGLDKLSINTPYKLVEELRAIDLDPIKVMAKKEFYDCFDNFVPLISKPNLISHYNPVHGYVRIDFGDRFRNSDFFKIQIQYHEYGHAIDYTQGMWQNKKEWVALFDKYAKEYNEDVSSFADGSILRGAKLYDKSIEEFYKTNTTINDYEEFSSVSDIFEAFDKEHKSIGYGGHGSEYFKDKSLCFAEFIAHASEFYWQGNRLFEKIHPSLYHDMIGLFGEFINKQHGRIR